MSEYSISYNMDTGDIMNCLSESEKVNFVYECFECLELDQNKILSNRLARMRLLTYVARMKLFTSLKCEDIKSLKMEARFKENGDYVRI